MQFLVAAALTATLAAVWWIQRSCPMYATAILGMNPRLFAQAAIGAMFFLFELWAVLLLTFALRHLVLYGVRKENDRNGHEYIIVARMVN